MEFYQLRTFVTVARERNLSRASERLFTSQSALSAQIKALEDELKIKLFERTPKGMVLTARGELLLIEAEKALAAMLGMLGQAEQLCGEIAGVIRLGTVTDPKILRIDRFLTEMTATYPRLQIELRHMMAAPLLSALQANELDAGCVVGAVTSPGIAAIRLCELRMVVAYPATWSERVAGADWNDIARLPWIGTPPGCCFRDLVTELFQKRGARFQPVVQVDQGFRDLVAAGVGVALMRESVAREAQSEGSIMIWPGEHVDTELDFVYLKDRAEEPAIVAACAAIARVWESPVPEGVLVRFPR